MGSVILVIIAVIITSIACAFLRRSRSEFIYHTLGIIYNNIQKLRHYHLLHNSISNIYNVISLLCSVGQLDIAERTARSDEQAAKSAESSTMENPGTEVIREVHIRLTKQKLSLWSSCSNRLFTVSGEVCKSNAMSYIHVPSSSCSVLYCCEYGNALLFFASSMLLMYIEYCYKVDH